MIISLQILTPTIHPLGRQRRNPVPLSQVSKFRVWRQHMKNKSTCQLLTDLCWPRNCNYRINRYGVILSIMFNSPPNIQLPTPIETELHNQRPILLYIFHNMISFSTFIDICHNLTAYIKYVCILISYYFYRLKRGSRIDV